VAVEYNWWRSGKNEPPPHLKTRKQLLDDGLVPLQPVGVIRAKRYDLFLYDPSDPNSVRPKKPLSDAQKAALDRSRRKHQYQKWLSEFGRFAADRNRAIEWARSVLREPDLFAVLDTETTGLTDAEIVEIGAVNLDGAVLFHSLIKPSRPIPPSATKIHGIDAGTVAAAPTFPEIYPFLAQALEERTIIIYNASFDTGVLAEVCSLHSLPDLGIENRSVCAMRWYAQFVGEWNSYFRSYKWQPLNGGHRALGDCLACLNLIRAMAAAVPAEISFEAWEASSQYGPE